MKSSLHRLFAGKESAAGAKVSESSAFSLLLARQQRCGELTAANRKSKSPSFASCSFDFAPLFAPPLLGTRFEDAASPLLKAEEKERREPAEVRATSMALNSILERERKKRERKGQRRQATHPRRMRLPLAPSACDSDRSRASRCRCLLGASEGSKEGRHEAPSEGARANRKFFARRLLC